MVNPFTFWTPFWFCVCILIAWGIYHMWQRETDLFYTKSNQIYTLEQQQQQQYDTNAIFSSRLFITFSLPNPDNRLVQAFTESELYHIPGHLLPPVQVWEQPSGANVGKMNLDNAVQLMENDQKNQRVYTFGKNTFFLEALPKLSHACHEILYRSFLQPTHIHPFPSCCLQSSMDIQGGTGNHWGPWTINRSSGRFLITLQGTFDLEVQTSFFFHHCPDVMLNPTAINPSMCLREYHCLFIPKYGWYRYRPEQSSHLLLVVDVIDPCNFLVEHLLYPKKETDF